MFYLVGSRLFGDFKEDSDWDYIAHDSLSNRDLLEQLGFKRLDSKHVRYHRDNVDVCLVTNLEAQLYARMMTYSYKDLPKAERHKKLKEFVDAYKLG